MGALNGLSSTQNPELRSSVVAAVLIREALLDHKLVGICDSECEVCVCVCSHVQI